jgi:hypothetical protein
MQACQHSLSNAYHKPYIRVFLHKFDTMQNVCVFISNQHKRVLLCLQDDNLMVLRDLAFKLSYIICHKLVPENKQMRACEMCFLFQKDVSRVESSGLGYCSQTTTCEHSNELWHPQEVENFLSSSSTTLIHGVS